MIEQVLCAKLILIDAQVAKCMVEVEFIAKYRNRFKSIF